MRAILAAWVSPSEPPSAVGSCANTPTGRPEMRAVPVTTPSPAGRLRSSPKAVERWRAWRPSSVKVPSSTRACTRASRSARMSRSLTASVPGQHEDGVLAAEAERVRHHHLDGLVARRLGDDVELDLGVLA